MNWDDLSDDELEARLVQRGVFFDDVYKIVRHARDGCEDCIGVIERHLG